jgi:hypothetical protein
MSVISVAPKPNIGGAIGAGLGQGFADVAKMSLNMKLQDMMEEKAEARRISRNSTFAKQFSKSTGTEGQEGFWAALGPELSIKMHENMSKSQLQMMISGIESSGLEEIPGMSTAPQQEFAQGQQFPEAMPMVPEALPPDRRTEFDERQVPTQNTLQPPSVKKSPGPSYLGKPVADMDNKEYAKFKEMHVAPKLWPQVDKQRSDAQKLMISQEKLGIEKEKFELEKNRDLRKEDRRFFKDASKASEAASIVENSLNQMKEIRERGNIGPGSAVKGILSSQTRADKAAYDTNASNIVTL